MLNLINKYQKQANKYLNPTPESGAALRGEFLGGAGLEKR